MNRTDRLLAIVLELQAKKYQRAEDLAATFEVSKRTIYRDVLALMESGVPVISTPGYGYALMEGYFLPPLSFTTDEAIMLLLGSDSAAQNFDAQYRAAAESASHKIKVVLPDPLREEVEYLQHSIRFISSGPGKPEVLRQLRRAIIQRRRVRFDYHARYSGPSTREADPYALVHLAQAWYLVAFDHRSGEKRTFRLDRLDNLTLLDKTFIRPTNLRFNDGDKSDRQLTVRALFAPEIARWIRESPSYFQVAAEEGTDGLLVTLQIRHVDEILGWLLSWGAQVQVLEPASVRERLKQEASAILQCYHSR